MLHMPYTFANVLLTYRRDDAGFLMIAGSDIYGSRSTFEPPELEQFDLKPWGSKGDSVWREGNDFSPYWIRNWYT